MSHIQDRDGIRPGAFFKLYWQALYDSIHERSLSDEEVNCLIHLMIYQYKNMGYIQSIERFVAFMGWQRRKVERVVGELIAKGVFHRTPDGHLYSSRMEAEIDAYVRQVRGGGTRKIQTENGRISEKYPEIPKKNWNIPDEKFPFETGKPNEINAGDATQGGAGGPHIDRDRDRDRDSKSRCPNGQRVGSGEDLFADGPVVKRDPKAPTYPKDFEVFWQAWLSARRGVKDNSSKVEAADEWSRLDQDGRMKATEAAPLFWNSIRAELAKRSDAPILHACRYLKKRRFDVLLAQHDQPGIDDAIPPPHRLSNGKVRQWGWWREAGVSDRMRLGDAVWREYLQKHPPNGVWPWWIFGAPPGHPECLVPQDIVAEKQWVDVYKGQIEHA